MKQIDSLKENYEFRRVYKRGKTSADSFVAVYKLKNYKKTSRLGVTVSNKIGKAVIRNKIRRRIKNSFHGFAIKEGFDLVIVARTRANSASYAQIEKSIKFNLKKIGAIDE